MTELHEKTVSHQALRDHARQMADMYEKLKPGAGLPYRLLADHGEEAVWSELPAHEEYGRAKQCYGNAGSRVLMGGADVLADNDLTYYEGYVGAGFVFEHAWAQDAEGRVYELTLRHNDRSCPFCDGLGELHAEDRWDYHRPDDDEDYDDEAEPEACEFCNGTGIARTPPRSLEGTTYLGVPVPTNVLRESVVENEVWGVLWTDPERVAKLYDEEAT